MNCQALYIQNFNRGMHDKQIERLAEVLQSRPNIWCLNVGETYNVKSKTWEKFARALKKTHVTHMYASEHTISLELEGNGVFGCVHVRYVRLFVCPGKFLPSFAFHVVRLTNIQTPNIWSALQHFGKTLDLFVVHSSIKILYVKRLTVH